MLSSFKKFSIKLICILECSITVNKNNKISCVTYLRYEIASDLAIGSDYSPALELLVKVLTGPPLEHDR